MTRAILCVTIVAAFSLHAAAAPPISEDIPIPGGVEAIAAAALLPTPPDRPRFVAEMARLIFEPTAKQRQSPQSRYAWLTAHLNALTRFERALARVPTGGRIALADASNGSVRSRLREFLEEVGLRLRESRGVYTVEATGDGAAAERAQLLLGTGVDVTGLEAALNRGDAVTFSIPSQTVPIPLTADLWGRAVFGREVPAADLFRQLMADERAALLCHGLAALDNATLAYIAAHPAILRPLYQRAAVFAAFGSHLRIRGQRVVTPGEEQGAAARELWEDLVDARAAEPERFVAALFGGGGRLAYLFDVVAELDPARRAFALGLWIADPGLRREAVGSLAAAAASAYPEWPASERPFARPLYDLATLLTGINVHPDGSPRLPASRRLWTRAFEGDDLPDDPERDLREIDRDGPIDAGWLAATAAAVDVRIRTDRVTQLAFGHRVFGETAPADSAHVLVALRAFRRYRTVMLGLEQMGVRAPATYASAARQAQRLSRLRGGRAFVAYSQFQGALALLVRLTVVGSLGADRVDPVVLALSDLRLDDDRRLNGAIADWLRRELLAGQGDDGAETAFLAALAGPVSAGGPETIAWEGELYRVDFAAAEEERLFRARERQGGYSLDAALKLETIARTLRAPSLGAEQVKAVSAALTALASEVPPRRERTASDFVPGGSEELPDPSQTIGDALRELERAVQPREVGRAAAVGQDLAIAADVMLGEVIASLTYALYLGDPDGVTLLGGDVARRHDFGIASRVPGIEELQPWAVPEQHYDPGVPWHVTGSLIGLDAALAPLTLRRLMTDDLPGPPRLGSNDRESLARTVALLNPFALRDAERDTIVAAARRGRQRVLALAADADVEALAAEVRMDGWRRRALQWTVAHERTRALAFFSITELVMLGGGNVEELHDWGTAMTSVSGCLCIRMPLPNTWRFVIGRPQTGLLGTAVTDVTLHVAMTLGDLKLPATLTRAVLGGAMQHFIDTAEPNDGNDWLTLVRAAQAIPRERIEDYVAAAAAGGPLVPVGDDASRGL